MAVQGAIAMMSAVADVHANVRGARTSSTFHPHATGNASAPTTTVTLVTAAAANNIAPMIQWVLRLRVTPRWVASCLYAPPLPSLGRGHLLDQVDRHDPGGQVGDGGDLGWGAHGSLDHSVQALDRVRGGSAQRAHELFPVDRPVLEPRHHGVGVVCARSRGQVGPQIHLAKALHAHAVAATRRHPAQRGGRAQAHRAPPHAHLHDLCARQRRCALVAVPRSPPRHGVGVADRCVWAAHPELARARCLRLGVVAVAVFDKALTVAPPDHARPQPASSFHATCCDTSALLNALGKAARRPLTPSTSAGCTPGARSSMGDHAVEAGHAGLMGGGVYSHFQSPPVVVGTSAAAANVATSSSRARHRRAVIVSLVVM